MKPWPDDLGYVGSELRWIEARCTRLALERQRAVIAGRSPRPRRSPLFRLDQPIDPAELPVKIVKARRRESEVRAFIDRRLTVHRREGHELALDRLVRLHGLDDIERTTLLLAGAPCISRKFATLYGALDPDEHEVLSVDAICTFAGLAPRERLLQRHAFGPRGRLVVADLVEVAYGRGMLPRDLLGADVAIRGRALSALLGDAGVGDELADVSDLEAARVSFDQLVLPADALRRILDVIDARDRVRSTWTSWGLDRIVTYGRGTVILLGGPSGVGKTATAHAIADRLGRRVRHVNVAALLAHEERGRFLPALVREARETNAVVLFDEADGILGARCRGNALTTVLLAEIERLDDDAVIILTTNVPEELDHAVERRAIVRINFAAPDARSRGQIWRTLLPPSVPLAPDVDLAKLAEHALTGGLIRNAIIAASARAVREAGEGEEPQLTQAILDHAAREQAEHGLVARRRGVGFDRAT